jgi:hypothetical protein
VASKLVVVKAAGKVVSKAVSKAARAAEAGKAEAVRVAVETARTHKPREKEVSRRNALTSFLICRRRLKQANIRVSIQRAAEQRS